MTDVTVYTKGTGSTYPVQEVIAPRYVVSQVRADNGLGGENAQNYTYQAMRAHQSMLFSRYRPGNRYCGGSGEKRRSSAS